MIPGLGRSPGEGNGKLLLPGESHGQGSLMGYSPGGREESDVTEHVHIFAPQNNGRIWASEILLHCD